MTKSFTPNDVLRFIYNETDREEHEQIRVALLTNNKLSRYYRECMETLNGISGSTYEPSEKCVQNILGYAKSCKLHMS